MDLLGGPPLADGLLHAVALRQAGHAPGGLASDLLGGLVQGPVGGGVGGLSSAAGARGDQLEPHQAVDVAERRTAAVAGGSHEVGEAAPPALPEGPQCPCRVVPEVVPHVRLLVRQKRTQRPERDRRGGGGRGVPLL